MNWQTKEKLTRKYHIRWCVSLIITNIVVLILCKQSIPNCTFKKSIKVAPKGYSRVILPIKVFIPLNNSTLLPPIQIGIYSPNKRLLIPKAFFHSSKIKGEGVAGVSKFQVDIPHDKLRLILPFLDSHLLAYPSRSFQKEKSYEVIF
jgi:hypothetical protein